MFQNTVVLLDSGHGNNTPGKRSPDGIFREYAWTRKVVEEVAKELRPISRVIRVVTEEEDVPLKERVKRVNKYCGPKDKVILISVHVNAAGNGDKWFNARGWSAWTSVGHTESDKVADYLYEAATEKFLPKGLSIRQQLFPDGDPDYEENFYILKHTKCPAVLIENFFMDNKEDYTYLLTEDSIKDCAQVIVEGLKAYFPDNNHT